MVRYPVVSVRKIRNSCLFKSQSNKLMKRQFNRVTLGEMTCVASWQMRHLEDGKIRGQIFVVDFRLQPLANCSDWMKEISVVG